MSERPSPNERGGKAYVLSEKPFRLVYLTATMPFGPEEQFLVAEAQNCSGRAATS